MLAESLRPQLKSFVCKWISNKDDVEDILQDVFYQLFRTLNENLCQIENLSAWLYRVARNIVINNGKRKCRNEESLYINEDEDGELMDFPADLFNEANPTPETVYLRSLVWQELDAALSELPPEQRAVFELTEYEGLTMKEISKQTGVSVNTLLSRKHYAVRHLRMRLGDLYRDILEY
ncbi:MAG: sigma-70 family RNA polymerase sigma factor [Bacteroides sp.]|nr:sigma-70 family RNA polymerase sigma factor [Bacteroides sp.]MCM1421336.1 sigma-70 family RNA polymerase sigma factor [Bacteroides sp.]